MKEWKISCIGDYLLEYHKLSNEINKYPVYSSSRKGLILQSDYYDKKEAVQTNLGYKFVPAGYATYRHMSDDDIFHFNINTTGHSILVSSEYPVFYTNDNANLYFVITYLNESPYFRNFCRIQKLGGTRTRLYFKKLSKFCLPFPPIEEQEKIAEILSTQDKLIELKQKLIDQKKQQKKWLMQNLLTGKIRLKGFEGEWKKVRLGDYIIEYTEKTTVNNQYPILTSSRKGLFLQSNYYNKQVASENNIGYNIVPYGYFTYRHMSDDEIFKFNVNTIVENGIVSTLYPVFTTKNLIDKWLLYTLNYGYEFPKYARIQKQGGSRTYMYLEKLKKIKLAFPAIKEQTAIAEILSVHDKEIQLLEKELEQEKLKKKALMQLLLTGKVRVI